MTKAEFDVWLAEFNRQEPRPEADCHWCGKAIEEEAAFYYGGDPPPRLYHPECEKKMLDFDAGITLPSELIFEPETLNG